MRTVWLGRDGPPGFKHTRDEEEEEEELGRARKSERADSRDVSVAAAQHLRHLLADLFLFHLRVRVSLNGL